MKCVCVCVCLFHLSSVWLLCLSRTLTMNVSITTKKRGLPQMKAMLSLGVREPWWLGGVTASSVVPFIMGDTEWKSILEPCIFLPVKHPPSHLKWILLQYCLLIMY